MRRAALCLISTLAMAVSLPALAQDTSQNTSAQTPASNPIVTSSVPGAGSGDTPAATVTRVAVATLSVPG